MSALKRQTPNGVMLNKAIEKGLENLNHTQIAEGQHVMSNYVRAYAVTPYMLAAVAYNAGVIAGKRIERQRRKPCTEKLHPWPFIETAHGRNLWRSGMENGDLAPYNKARAKYDLMCEMTLGAKPPKCRYDGTTTASSYRELLDTDLPMVSDRLHSIVLSMAELRSVLEALTARAEVMTEWAEGH